MYKRQVQDDDRAQHADRARRPEQPAQHGEHPAAAAQQPDQGQALPVVAGPGRVHRVRQADGLADGGEAETPALQGGQHAVEGGDGLRAVAARVVHQQDLPLVAGPGGGRPDDLGHARAAPVLAVPGGEHRQVALPPGLLDGGPAGVVHGLGGGRVRRPQQRTGDVGHPGQGQLRLAQLQGAAPGGRGAEVGVGEGVDADLVALGDDPADQLRVGGGLGADHEEGGVDAGPAQHVEDLRGPARVGAVVEGERDRAGLGRGRTGLPARAVDHRAAGADRLGDAGGGGRGGGLVGTVVVQVLGVALEQQGGGQGEQQGRQQEPVRAQRALADHAAPAPAAVPGGRGGSSAAGCAHRGAFREAGRREARQGMAEGPGALGSGGAFRAA